MALRILTVGNMYPPHHQGGYELVWQSLNARARSDGHVVRVLTSVHRDPGVDVADEPDVHRTLKWYWDWHRYEFGRLTIAQRLAIERANHREFTHHLRDFRPDVVVWWCMGHMSLSLIERVRRAGIPAVFSVHNDWLIYGWEADQWTRLWLGRSRAWSWSAETILRIPTSCRLDDAGPILFNSRYTQQAAEAAGLDNPLAAVVHPGVAHGFLHPAPARPWSGRLLYIGRIDRGKGVDTAVEALRHLPADTRLTICGKGDVEYGRQLLADAARAGTASRIEVKAFMNQDEMHGAYAGADAVLFPVRWQEPWGLVPLEAMGVGRPVVTTAMGGTSEFVRDGDNALVVAPDDALGIARAVSRLASEPDLRDRLVAGGRATASRFTAEAFDRETLARIVAAAGSPPRGGQ